MVQQTMISERIKLLGNTPLIPIPTPFSPAIQLMAKLEWMNPSGSVKDRAAAAIITDALDRGVLDGKTMIDATSGNTGIAYAMWAAILGLPIELALPENASEERKQLLRCYGAKIHYTDPLEGTDGAQRFVADRVAKHPDQYYYLDQYNNDRNWQAHLESTGPEIWDQTKGDVTHFVAGLGTTGTFVGTSRFLQPKGVHCVSVQPDSPMHGLEGWKHMETAIVPGIYDTGVADEAMTVSTDKAFQFARAAGQYLGLFLSPSSAANLVAAFNVMSQLSSGVVVTIFPDSGYKYMQDSFWCDDDYLIDNPFI